MFKASDNHKIQLLVREGNSDSIVQSTAVKPPSLGFYDKVRVSESTINRPSFLNDSFDSIQSYSSKQSFVNDEKVDVVSNNQKVSLASKPAFNVSAFISPNPGSQNLNSSMNTTFDLSSVNKSLFYSGQTKFGGSSTYRQNSIKRHKTSPVSNQACTALTQMKAKPLPYAKKSAVTSATAKKILVTLDKMSSPVKDSRKLPSMQHLISPLTFSQKLRDSSKKKDLDIGKPPVVTLDTAKVSQKGFSLSTNNTTTDTHQLHSNAKPLNPVESFTFVKPEPFVTEKSVLNEIQLDSDSNTSKTGNSLSRNIGKLRRERTSTHYSVPKGKDIVNTLPEIVNVSFSVTSVPSFSSSFQSSNTEVLPNPFISNENKQISAKETFKFSTPDILAVRNPLETPATHFYVFSEPIPITKQPQKVTLPTELSSAENAKKEGNAKNEIKLQTVKLSGSWECGVCLVQNNIEAVKCAACEHLKPIGNEKLNVPFASSIAQVSQIKLLSSKFSKPESSWDCSTCLINNKSDSEKCVACETPKPKLIAHKQLPSLQPKLNIVTSGGSWSCQTCLVSNKECDEKCIACTAMKPKNTEISSNEKIGLFKLKLPQKAEGTWNCPTCMIDNQRSAPKCVACGEKNSHFNETLESSALTKPDKVSSKFTFGVLSCAAETPATFSFGNPSLNEKKMFNFEKPVNSTGFSFGQQSSENKPVNLFKFGLTKSDIPQLTDQCKPLDTVSIATDKEKGAFNASVDTSNLDKFDKRNLTSSSSIFAKSVPESSIFSFGKPNISTSQNDIKISTSAISAHKLPNVSETKNFFSNLTSEQSNLTPNSVSTFTFGINSIESKSSESLQLPFKPPLFLFGKVSESSVTPFQWGSTAKNTVPDPKPTENPLFSAYSKTNELVPSTTSIATGIFQKSLPTSELQQSSPIKQTQPSIFALSTTNSFNFTKTTEVSFLFGSSNSTVSKPTLTSVFGTASKVFGSSVTTSQSNAGFSFGNAGSTNFSTSLPSFNFSTSSKPSFLSENPMPSFMSSGFSSSSMPNFPTSAVTKPFDFSSSKEQPSFNFTSAKGPSFNFSGTDNVPNITDNSKGGFLNGTIGLFSIGAAPSTNERRHKPHRNRRGQNKEFR